MSTNRRAFHFTLCESLYLFMVKEFMHVYIVCICLSSLAHCNHFAFSASKRIMAMFFSSSHSPSSVYTVFVRIYSSFSCSDFHFVLSFFHPLYNQIHISQCAPRFYFLIYLSTILSLILSLCMAHYLFFCPLARSVCVFVYV